MNVLRKILFSGLLSVGCFCAAFGQDSHAGRHRADRGSADRWNAEKIDRPNTKRVNFGIKAGFNSSMFMVAELKIKDVTIDQVQNNYKIGYFGALFMRINMKKHFIQPEVSYNVTKCEITSTSSARSIPPSNRIMPL